MNIGKENETTEFKKTTGELKEGIQSLASMLNKSGKGVLYFGVKNNGDVVGQHLGETTLRDISQAIANHIKPQVIPTIDAQLLENVIIIKVAVEGNNKPYSAYGKYYIRTSDEDRDVSPEQLKQLMLFTNNEDSITKIESDNQELTFNTIKSLYLSKGYTLDENTYKNNMKLLTKGGKYNLLANLMSDKNDVSIKVARFSGKDKTELVKRNEYGYKCLLIAMQQVLDYIEALNETFVEIKGAKRIEKKLFDFLCFREAWLNACLHNSWHKHTPPAVYVFNDRIEIISTGGLPADYSKEEFYKGISHPINIELQKIMGQLDYVEQTGHGVPLIVSKYGKDAFNFTDNFINVTIPFSSEQTIPQALNIKLSFNQQRVVNMMIENPHITSVELIELTQLSKTSIYNIIKRLKEQGVIERIGSDKNGYWKVK